MFANRVQRWGMAAFVIVALTIGCACADSAVDVFVGKSQLSGVVHNGRVYTPAAAMLTAMGYSWVTTDDGYRLTPGGTAAPTITRRLFALHLDGRSASPATLWLNGRVYMDVRTATEGLGGVYVYTPSAAIAQATFPPHHVSARSLQRAVAKAEVADAKARAAAAHRSLLNSNGENSGADIDDSETGAKKKTSQAVEKAPDDEPISVSSVDYSTSSTGMVNGKAVLTNDADQPIHNVFVFFTVTAPEESTTAKAAADNNTGLGGGASMAPYVKESENYGSFGGYDGTPPSNISNDYPSHAPESSAGPATVPTGAGAGTYYGPNAAPTPTPAAEATPTPTPTPTPEYKDVAMLPAVFVANIDPGQSVTVPFEWRNTKSLAVRIKVETRHEKVAFTRKKEDTDEDSDKSAVKSDKDKSDKDKSDKDKSDKDKSDKDKSDKDKSDKDKTDKDKTDKDKTDQSKTDQGKTDQNKSGTDSTDDKTGPP